jgi:hypothetical protein
VFDAIESVAPDDRMQEDVVLGDADLSGNAANFLDVLMSNFRLSIW